MFVQQNVRSAKRPSAKCPFGKMSFGKMSFGKVSFGRMSGHQIFFPILGHPGFGQEVSIGVMLTATTDFEII
jgi:hypothetical protein